MSNALEVNDTSFEQEVKQSEIPVLWIFGHHGATMQKNSPYHRRNCAGNIKDALKLLKLILI